jgi:protein-disulfide isomerase/uncharacterized membrane protein
VPTRGPLAGYQMKKVAFLKKNTIEPLPYGFYFTPVMALTLVGVLASCYLAVSHYRVYTDIGYSSFCAISRSLNCDTVSQSPYSIFLNVPVPLWGVLGYILFGTVLFFSRKPTPEGSYLWTFLFVIAMIFSSLSIVLAVISTVYIRSYCLMCILSYGINFLLLFYTWLVRRRYRAPNLRRGMGGELSYLIRTGKGRSLCAALGLLVGISVLIVFAYPKYWIYKNPLHSSGISTGFTESGEPWIGALNPEIVIEEFADYQCFQCRKTHFYLRQIIAEHPDKIRLVHRQFPMDDRVNPLVQEPFHRGSGKMALIAIAAGRQGKFWEANDYLYQAAHSTETITVDAIAAALALDEQVLMKTLQSPSAIKELERDLIDGIKLGVTGTPTFVINGNVYAGSLPAEILQIMTK